jgi:hypothetical protein
MFMLAGKLDQSVGFKPPIPVKAKALLFMLLCGIQGLAFGVLYAPYQALIMGWDFDRAVMWVKIGLPFDFAHGVNNFAMGILIIPLSDLLRKLDRQSSL